MTEKCAVCAQSCLFPECIINCIRARSHSSTGMNPFVHKCNLQIVSIYPHKGICLFISRIIPTLILELNIPLFAIEYCPICQRALAHSTYSNGKRGTTKNWEELVSCQKYTQHKTHKNIIAEPWDLPWHDHNNENKDMTPTLSSDLTLYCRLLDYHIDRTISSSGQ